jgi:neutral amino acid transport system substrate-binding protein
MNQLVDVSATATSTLLTGSTVAPANKGYFFRTVPSDAYQAIAVGIFALEGPAPDAGKAGCHKMDIMYNMDTYGEPLEAAIKKYFTAPTQGGVIPASPGGEFEVSENETSTSILSGIASQVLTDLPDCMVLAVYPQTAAGFMAQLSQALMAGTPDKWSKSFFVIGTDGTYDPSLITDGLENASMPDGGSFVNGTSGPPMYGTVALTNDHTNPNYNELVEIYEAEVGLQPGMTDLDPYTANEYDAVVLTLLAMQSAGTTTDGPAIQQAMFNVSHGKTGSALSVGPADLASAISTLQMGGDINYQGASGDVDFDEYGNVVANFLIWQVSGSVFVNHSTISATKLTDGESHE